MSFRVASFQFASDSTFADQSTCTIDWTAETITFPGRVTPVAFGHCDELVTIIQDLAAQDEGDGIAETEKEVLNGGPTVKYDPDATPRTIAPGANAFPVAKAAALAAGIQEHVVDVLNP